MWNFVRKFTSTAHIHPDQSPNVSHEHDTDYDSYESHSNHEQNPRASISDSTTESHDQLTQSQVGLLFQTARRELNISLTDIAEATRIRLAYLEAIESGQFHRLPSPIYIAGFIRLYARYVQLDGEEILRRIDLEHTQTHITHRHIVTPHSAKPSRFIVSISVLLIALSLGLYKFGMFDTQAPKSLSDTSDLTQKDVDTLTTDADVDDENALDEEIDTHESTNDTPPTADQDVSHHNDAPTQSADHTEEKTLTVAPSVPHATPVNAHTASEARLILRAHEDCWISLTQDGKKLFAATLKKGNQFESVIRADATLTVGNAPALDIVFNDTLLPSLSRHDHVVRNVNIFQHKEHASSNAL